MVTGTRNKKKFIPKLCGRWNLSDSKKTSRLTKVLWKMIVSRLIFLINVIALSIFNPHRWFTIEVWMLTFDFSKTWFSIRIFTSNFILSSFESETKLLINGLRMKRVQFIFHTRMDWKPRDGEWTLTIICARFYPTIDSIE